jgi:hypothetical protein
VALHGPLATIPAELPVTVNRTESLVHTDVAVDVRVAPLKHGPCANVSLEESKAAKKKMPAKTFILEALFVLAE